MTYKKTLISDDTPNIQRDEEPKVIQRFPDVVKEVETVDSAEVTETVQDDKSKERSERRSVFKKAADIEARAMAMQKTAEEKLKKAEHWEQISQKFQQDPTSVAEAFGLSREEFLRKYQNHVFSINEETPEPKDPVEEMKARMESLESERAKEKEEQKSIQYQLTKSTYINSNILPTLNDKDKYKFLNKNGMEESSSYLYDLMNTHYMQTGEELSIQEVADVAESKLKEAWTAKMNEIKEMGLLDEYMGTSKKEAPAQLGGSKPSRTLSDTWNSSSVPVQKQRQSFLSREDRLAKTTAALEAIANKN